jgi:hypothetical protein
MVGAGTLSLQQYWPYEHSPGAFAKPIAEQDAPVLQTPEQG